MSLLEYLEFQPIDRLDDALLNEHASYDVIRLDEPVDEPSLEKFWDRVVEDIHKDPEWFTFDNT